MFSIRKKTADAGQITGLLSPYLEGRRLAHLARHIGYGTRVLDIGCGRGKVLDFIHPSYYLGVDILERVNRQAGRLGYNVKFIQMDIEKETIGAEHCPFDVIIMAAVIEHLKDPAATLSVLNEYLTECGKIILTTPAPIGHLIIEPLSSLGILSHDASEEHKDLLSRGDIEIYAKKSGLQVTHYGKFLFGMNQIAILQKSKGDNLQILMPSNFTM